LLHLNRFVDILMIGLIHIESICVGEIHIHYYGMQVHSAINLSVQNL
jgi:hypothetical protein